MKYKVEKITFKGLQHIMFTGDDGSPLTGNLTVNWANTYIEKDKSTNTVTSRTTEAKHLLFCLHHFMEKQIDVVNRVEAGKFFTSIEISQFARYCFKKAKVVQQQANNNVISLSTKDFISPAYQSATFADERVCNNTAAARMRCLKSYLVYLYKRLHTSFVNTDIYEKYKYTIRELTREIKKAKKENSTVVDIDKPIFDDDVLELLFQITQVGHPDNPFKSAQLRNRVMLDTIYATGIRRGALLQLKITDLRDENIERISINKRVNHDDPRHHRPTQKTQSAQVAIEPEILLHIKKYVNDERAKYPESESHDFIFVAEWGANAGRPLSISGFNYLFETLSGALSNKLGRNIKINPHMLRHYWNMDFSERAEAAGLTNVETDRLRKQMMTWSQDSKMSEIYNIRATLKRVRTIKQNYQSQLFYTTEE